MSVPAKLFFFLLFIVASQTVFSMNGDTINIITHNKAKVVTDPSKGYNAYKNWSVFPPQEIKYRKAILFVTYQCPDSQRCGEWDYIDNIFLRRKGSINDSSLDIELARMISPYGSRFTPEWKFVWKSDITDFSFLLHDSVEIEFNHTGYESNKDRGWLVTLDFELTEGIPVMEVTGYEKLWTGSFPYGNEKDDIENYLNAFAFENKYGADIARLRILQTGHGMDDFENCSEFCNKYRKIFFNDELIEQKQIWRECADNPLFPQAGTWIFDRANWCPGAMVNPDIYDLRLTDSSGNTIDIEMEPYVNPNKPSANYVFSSYLFYYKNPVLNNDVSLEEIISPGNEDIYLGKNPVCKFPVILIKNNGNLPLTELTINYQLTGGGKSYLWTGELESLGSEEIVIPEVFAQSEGEQVLKVSLKDPNGAEDEYTDDNAKISIVNMPPVFDPKIILSIRTNNEASHNFYQLISERNLILMQKRAGALENNKIYNDTFNLGSGCYEFVFGDTANDGLDFWFNQEGGYGYVRITDINGKLIKSFNSDFGKEIRQQFIVTGAASVSEDLTPVLNIFPIRNPGKFFCDIFLNEKQNITLQITTEDKKKIVYEKKLKKFKEGMIDIDISKKPEGFYFVNVIAKNRTAVKKIKLKKD